MGDENRNIVQQMGIPPGLNSPFLRLESSHFAREVNNHTDDSIRVKISATLLRRLFVNLKEESLN